MGGGANFRLLQGGVPRYRRVHPLSRWEQLARTVERYYAGVPDLVVLVVDDSKLDDLRIEPSPSTGESFPHLYGPLPVTAVTEVLPLAEALERARA